MPIKGNEKKQVLEMPLPVQLLYMAEILFGIIPHIHLKTLSRGLVLQQQSAHVHMF